MTDVSTRYRPSSERRRRSLREVFTRAARHYRLERRSLPRVINPKTEGGKA